MIVQRLETKFCLSTLPEHEAVRAGNINLLLIITNLRLPLWAWSIAYSCTYWTRLFDDACCEMNMGLKFELYTLPHNMYI